MIVLSKEGNRVADEKEPGQQGRDWLDNLSDADGFRNYRPVTGPDEPAQPPPGRASASSQPSDQPEVEGKDAQHSDPPADQDS